MNLTIAASGPGGHTVVTCDGTKILVNFHKTSPKERGMIETLVEKAKAAGLTLHRSKKGEAGDVLPKIHDVLMDSKNEIVLLGTKDQVEEIAFDLVDQEIRNNRVVAEAQEDGSWKVLRLGEFKKNVEASKELVPAGAVEEPEKKRAVSSHEKVGGG